MIERAGTTLVVAHALLLAIALVGCSNSGETYYGPWDALGELFFKDASANETNHRGMPIPAQVNPDLVEPPAENWAHRGVVRQSSEGVLADNRSGSQQPEAVATSTPEIFGRGRLAQTPLQAQAAEAEGYWQRCLLRFAGDITVGREHYLASAPRRRGPRRSRFPVLGTRGLSTDTVLCHSLRDSAGSDDSAGTPSKPPVGATPPPAAPQAGESDLRAGGEALVSALQNVAALMNELHQYYGGDAFQRDRGALGRQRHEPMVDAFDTFGAAHERFESLATPLIIAARQERIAALVGNPETELSHLAESMIEQARVLAGAAQSLSLVDHRYRSAQPARFDANLELFLTFPPKWRAGSGFGQCRSFDEALQEFTASVRICRRRAQGTEMFTYLEERRLSDFPGYSNVPGSSASLERLYETLMLSGTHCR